MELSITVSLAEVDELLARPADRGSPEDRLLELVEMFNRYTASNEALMRTAQRHYLDTWLAAERAGEGHDQPLREGRRLQWIAADLGAASGTAVRCRPATARAGALPRARGEAVHGAARRLPPRCRRGHRRHDVGSEGAAGRRTPLRGGCVGDTLRVSTPEELAAAAGAVRADLELDAVLGTLGEPHLVGSAALGLMVWPDLDMTVVCDALDVAALHSAGGRSRAPSTRATADLSERLRPLDSHPEKYPDGVYWGIDYRDGRRTWNIDVWFVTEADRHQPASCP